MVAEDMREQGFEVDGTQCDEKFRNLKKTYKKIRANHNSKGPEKWEFYSLMEELVGETLTTAEVLPPAVYESSQPKFIILSPGYEQITEHKPTLKSYSREQTVVFPSSNYDSDDNVGNVGKRKKRQRPTWFDDYLSELRRKEAARERRHKEKLEQREREINDKAVFRAEVLKILEKMVEDK